MQMQVGDIQFPLFDDRSCKTIAGACRWYARPLTLLAKGSDQKDKRGIAVRLGRCSDVFLTPCKPSWPSPIWCES